MLISTHNFLPYVHIPNISPPHTIFEYTHMLWRYTHNWYTLDGYIPKTWYTLFAYMWYIPSRHIHKWYLQAYPKIVYLNRDMLKVYMSIRFPSSHTFILTKWRSELPIVWSRETQTECFFRCREGHRATRSGCEEPQHERPPPQGLRAFFLWKNKTKIKPSLSYD